MPGRVLLVEDVDELRAVIMRAVKLKPGLEVVGEARQGNEAIAKAKEFQPDVVVLDLGLPDLAGHEVLSGIRRVAPAAQVVVYSGTHTNDRRALARRAEGFVSKQHEVKYLVDLLADLSRRNYQAALLGLTGALDEVFTAREFLKRQCNIWGCAAVVDDALVVLSELVANAIVHARSSVDLRLVQVEGILRIEVTDYGGGAPDLQAPGPAEDHGRGLLLVSVFSASWGVDSLDEGKCVWAEVTMPAGRGRPANLSSSALPGPLARGGVARAGR